MKQLHNTVILLCAEETDSPSLWPSGPYALLMSKFGCLESHSKGWRKGVLKIEASSQGEDLEFHFCVKVRHDPELDKGIWIPGNYTIFKKGETCPKGFSDFQQTWNNATFSYFPNCTFNSTGITSITFNMCERNVTTNTENSNYGMLQTAFVFGKKKDSECLQFGTTTEDVAVCDEANLSFCFHKYQPYEKLNGWQYNDILNYVNVALHKPAYMTPSNQNYRPNMAVDGVKMSSYRLAYSFVTPRAKHNWWYVDLQNIYKIERVVLRTSRR